MSVYEVLLRVEADEDTTPEMVRQEIYRACDEVPFGFDVEKVEARMSVLDEIDRLAEVAHCGQVDKIGDPYVNHVRSVAAGLVAFPVEVQMAGLLHDILEDTEMTAYGLRRLGVQERVIRVVEAVTKQKGLTREANLRRVLGGGYHAILVKISDNAHNSRPDRAARIDDEATRIRLAEKYREARKILWPAAQAHDIEEIVRIVNPHLLGELNGLDAS